MEETNLGIFWQIVGWVFALSDTAFQRASEYPRGWWIATGIVLLAGLSQSIGQSVILFINRVKPLRFLLSLGVSVILFIGGFLALVLSTWLITLMSQRVDLPLVVLVTILGLSYAPLLFSFLGALPYLGEPILALLSIWNLLAANVGFAAVTGLSPGRAFGYVVEGWILLQILQQTVGQPLANAGKWLANTAAGVQLTTHSRALTAIIDDRANADVARLRQEMDQRIARTQELRQTSQATVRADPTEVPRTVQLSGVVTTTAIPSVVQGSQRGWSNSAKALLGCFAIALLTGIMMLLLRPLREWWFGWYGDLPSLMRQIFDLVWIGFVALVVAGLLAPLETLGWYAGWYQDEVDMETHGEDRAIASSQESHRIARYVVYLDGIGKSTFEYLPDIEEFLQTLILHLPEDVMLVRGIMPYSVVNKPLNRDRPLALLWRFADKVRFANPTSLLGMLVNIRNVLVVGVSADRRYGPLYNQGIAQVVFNGLMQSGYPLGSGTPVTLIGYSGGGQMSCAAVPFLKRALNAPLKVISLGGVMSANNNILRLEHLHHLVGSKDPVERIGPVMFPGRWKIFPLSYWNRAKRQGKITIIPMGPVGHQVPGGILDPNLILIDGRSALQQTIDTIKAIFQDDLLAQQTHPSARPTNYSVYQQADFIHPNRYPLQQSLEPNLYRPIGNWMGRLILPEKSQRQQVRGVLIEIYYAPLEYRSLVGKTVILRWSDDPRVQRLVQAVKRDVHFSAAAEHASRVGGMVLPERLNHWSQVDPLESLAGAHPVDDITVMLEYVEVSEAAQGSPVLKISTHPIEITGRYYGLVKFLQPVGPERYLVRHFNRSTRKFDGPEEVVAIPEVVKSPDYGSFPSTVNQIEKTPDGEMGWYIYGAKNYQGMFVVQSWLLRSHLRLYPDRVIFGRRHAYRYIRKEAWRDIISQKGRVTSVLCTPERGSTSDAVQVAMRDWREGDQALVLHVYGGIGGNQSEPAAATPIFFGHFAYGTAHVVHEPLAGELHFDIRYHQVYTQNTDGLTAGTLHICRYLGDRQFGWLGNRPICDLIVKLPCFTGTYDFMGDRRSPLWRMESFLQAMTARYRIGDGTGATFVGPANNCSQDSNQALFAAIQQMGKMVTAAAEDLDTWAQNHPSQWQRFQQLLKFGRDLKRKLQPIGNTRPDWEQNEFNLGSTLEDEPLRNITMGLGSWRTLLPRKASDTVVKEFLDHGASVWVLRTNQVGGYDPNIQPKAPITF